MLKLNIGCGRKRIPGYVGCDIIPGECVDVICCADNLPYTDGEVDEILTEHMIEHLTFEEFDRAVAEWSRVLKVGGALIIECPDILGMCKQFIEANDYGRFNSYYGYWPLICQLYGHQRGSSKEEKLSQVHKSGYTVDRLKFVLSGIGFGKFSEEKSVRQIRETCFLRLKSIKIKERLYSE